MKIPEKAPQLSPIQPENLSRMVTLSASQELYELLKRSNEEYVYWDTFKYYNFPEEIPKELAWMYLKLTRQAQIRKIPMEDKEGKNFGYWLPDCVLKILHDIDQNAGGQILVENPAVHSGEKERYLVSSIMEEAIASSQLEGAATTRKKAKELLRSGRKPLNTAEQMIINNYITIRNIKNLIDKPLTKDLIIEIQASITKNTLEDLTAVGRFRKSDEQNQVIDQRDGQVLFEPPPADELDDRINDLCNYANELENKEFIHPVIKAIILHFWLAYIHPFVDGNGRTARAIFYWYMLRNKYWLFEYLSISRIIVRAPAQYARAYLYSEIDNLDLTYFLVFNLKTINLAIKALNIYLAAKQKEISETNKFIRKYPGLNHRECEILYHAVSHPDAMYTIRFHKNVYDIAYQTARTDLMKLEKRGFLIKMKRGKEFFFIPAKDLHKKIRQIGI